MTGDGTDRREEDSDDGTGEDPDPPGPAERDVSDATRASPTDRGERASADAEKTRSAVSAEEHVVPKGTYCQTCPHLSEPPSFVCTHEGTTIVELVDVAHVRVQNCPVVDGTGSERALEAEDGGGANE